MRKLFIDMDETLVGFKSGINRLGPAEKEQYREHYDDCPGIFSLMDPMPEAVDAVKVLCSHFDCYIISCKPKLSN